MNEKKQKINKEKKAALVDLSKFSFTHKAFFFLHQISSPALQLEEYYSTQKNNACVFKKKIRHQSSAKQENLLNINGKEYRIEHNFENEEKSERKKHRKKRYPSGGTSVVKKLIPCDDNDLCILRLKCFNKLANENIYNNTQKTAEKYLLSVNIHKNIFKRNSTAFYMRNKNGSTPKFYMIMNDLGEHDLFNDMEKNYSSFYQDEKTLLVRLNIAIQILEQIQLLFDRGIRWLDPKIENVIVHYNFDRSSCRVEITDFDSVIEEKKSKRLKSYKTSITYLPKSREIDYLRYSSQKLQYSTEKVTIDQIFDRGYVISALSLTLSQLFPAFIEQRLETSQHNGLKHKNIFLILRPKPRKLKDDIETQILKVVQSMYGCARTNKFDNSIDLKKYIRQLKAIKHQLHPLDENIHNALNHNLSNVLHQEDDGSKNLPMLNRYYRIKFMTGIAFISIISWNLLDQSYKSLIDNTIFKTSGIIAYIATAVFCLMLCACIIYHKKDKNKLHKESWCNIFGLISAAIGCIVCSVILSNQKAFSNFYSEQALGCFLATILLLTIARQLHHSANPNRKYCTSFEALFVLIQILPVGALLSTSLIHNHASMIRWTTLCALSFGILAALTMTIKDVFSGKESGVDYFFQGNKGLKK